MSVTMQWTVMWRVAGGISPLSSMIALLPTQNSSSLTSSCKSRYQLWIPPITDKICIFCLQFLFYANLNIALTRNESIMAPLPCCHTCSLSPIFPLTQVSRVAGVLLRNGIQKGDLVVIYMPMVPQAMFAMLACARIGATHSLIFGGFASRELAVRIDHAKVQQAHGRMVGGCGGIGEWMESGYKNVFKFTAEIHFPH